MKTISTFILAIFATVSAFASNGIVRNDATLLNDAPKTEMLSATMDSVLAQVVGASVSASSMEADAFLMIQTTENQDVIVTDMFAKHSFIINQTSDAIEPIMVREAIILDAEEL